jgi:hypothetical protein
MIVLKVRVDSKFPQLNAEAERLASRAVKHTAERIHRVTAEMMGEPKTGRVYPHGPTGLHQASSPGEAPAIETHQLVNSLKTEYLQPQQGYVYTETEYSVYLEFGTSRMAKRPFFGPAAQIAWPDFAAEMAEIYG